MRFIFTVGRMNKKRILILTNRVPYPLNDGGNMAMNAMIDGYHEAGMDVYLLAMNTTRHPVPPEQLRDIYQHTEGFNAVAVDNSVRVWGTLMNFLWSREPNHASRFKHKEFEEKLIETMAYFKPDIIHVESIFLSSYMPLIRSKSSAKLVLRLHNIEHEVWERAARHSKNPLKRYYLNNLAGRIKAYENKVWHEYDLLLPITHADAKVLVATGVKVPYVVAHFAFAAAPFALHSADVPWCAYHLGAMDWIPNRDAMKWFLMKVWPEIRKVAPDFRFYFAGRYMPAYFKSLNIAGVQCEGEVADAQEFIAGKRILIVPLKAGGGIRIKILEAMAAEKLVICTRIAMQGIDANAGEHYIEANEAHEFAAAIDYVLHHKTEALQIAARGRMLVLSQYKRQHIMDEVIAAIQEL